MVVLDGHITDQIIEGNNYKLTDDLENYDRTYVWNSPYLEEPVLALEGQRIINYPSVFAPGLLGHITHHYKEDYYHRIHVAPETIALGNLFSDAVRYIYVWNAFFEAKTLNNVTKEDVTGIEITEPVTTPADYAPLEEKTYTANISTIGPPTIAATVNFEFAVYTMSMEITGNRIILWTWIPKGEYTEELQWLTNILKTRVGEQRIALREAPRQIFNFDFLRPPREASQVKIAATDWVYQTWGLPVWKEMTSNMNVSAGVTSVNFDTSNSDYREDGLAIIWESSDKAEAMQITNLRTDGIDINQALQDSYTDALVMPLRQAIIPDGISFSRTRSKWTPFSATFVVIDNIDLSGTTPYEQYDGYDVLTDGNIVIGDMSERISRPMVQIDNGQGPITIETTQDYSRFKRTVGKFAKTKAELWEWRQWLHSKYGRQKAFWLPSWNKDIDVVKTIPSTDTEVDVAPLGLTIHGDFPIDTRLILTDDTVFYRQITGSEKLTDGSERITISSSFGREIAPDDIKIWSVMDLVRFDADSIELEHQNPYIMKNSIPVTRVNDL